MNLPLHDMAQNPNLVRISSVPSTIAAHAQWPRKLTR